jgi:hypothetical protein
MMYEVTRALLIVLPLSVIACYFWAYPDEWTKAMKAIRDAFDGPPQASA